MSVWQKDLDLSREQLWKTTRGKRVRRRQVTKTVGRPPSGPAGVHTLSLSPALTVLGDSGFCSRVVTCVPARLRLLFTLVGVFSSPGQSGRFTEGRDTGLGMDGERKRLRGRQRITGWRKATIKKVIHPFFFLFEERQTAQTVRLVYSVFKTKPKNRPQTYRILCRAVGHQWSGEQALHS